VKPQILLLSAFGLLAACATPQERCVANVTKNMRVLDSLIAETRGNLARGFAIRTESFVVNETQKCGQEGGKDVFCEVAVADERKVPVAIDLGDEQKKLDSLLQRRSAMNVQSQAAVAQCRAQFPEA